MNQDDLLYSSVFVMFLGFLIFIVNTINQRFGFFSVFDSFYVLFFFLGIFISLAGFIMMLYWHVKNKSPYIVKKKNNHFQSYLGIGLFLLLTGLTVFVAYSDVHIGVFILSISTSIIGIILLLLGLEYFVREVLMENSKKNLFAGGRDG